MSVKNAIWYVLLCSVLFNGQLGAQSSGVWRSPFGIRPEKVTPAFPVFGTEVFGVPQGSGFNRYAYSSVVGSCTNGIQDVFEEGVDCGGVLCPPCGTCSDNIQNGMETGVDCGGPQCPPCATCTDNIQNGQETGVDCGGPTCPPCATCFDGVQNGQETGIDCGGPTCAACPTCSDGVQNGQETGVDCGGPNCPACETCDDGIQNGGETGIDCGGSNCPACPTCDDGIRNGGETGVDCGGPDCPACPTCDDGIQNGTETGVDCGGVACIACPTCEDGIQNGEETGVDCGGPDCADCPPPCYPPTNLLTSELVSNRVQLNWTAADEAVTYSVQIKLIDSEKWFDFSTAETSIVIRGLSRGAGYEWRVRTQCPVLTSDWSAGCNFVAGDPASANCNPDLPTCGDGIQNGGETGVDCGGSDCPACPSCGDGVQNGSETGVDCGGSDCPACPTCEDGIQNGTETGVDCGGLDCVACPSCDDGVQNGQETGVDCGGPDCAVCPPVCAVPAGLVAENHERNRVRLSWSAESETRAYQVRIRVIAEGFTGTWYNFTTSETQIVIRGTATGTRYECQLQSVCETLNSPWSDPCVFVGGNPDINGCPPVPTCEDGIQNGLELGVDCGGPDCNDCPCDAPVRLGAAGSVLFRDAVFLFWSRVATAESYLLQVRKVGDPLWTSYTVHNGDTLASPDRSLSQIGVLYEWRVRAVCPNTAGEWSVICTYLGGSAEFTSSCGDTPEEDATCEDGIQNGYEEGIDCGGPDCLPCPTCEDGIQNGNETGVDCGGPNCPTCPPACDPPYNLYASNFERNTVRLNWNSSPGALYYVVQLRGIGYGFAVQTGSITDTTVLLGNSIPMLPVSWWVEAYCAGGEKAVSVACEFRRSTRYSAVCDPPAPTCSDGIQNGDEAGVDCGGSACAACPSCEDGTQNGSETGVDCGGPDCAACPTCEDGIQNGSETGVDCGGPDCVACPTCEDGIQNGLELDVDCGGPDCSACPCGQPYNLYASNFTNSNFRLNWNGSPKTQYYKVQLRGINWNFSMERTTTDTTLLLGYEVPMLPIRWWVEAYCVGESMSRSVDCEFERNRTYSGNCDLAPSCEDGIQNGQETGVDCGGPDCPECLPACYAPYNLYADDFSIARRSVRLNWSAVPGARYYRVYYKIQGYGTIPRSVSTNTITLAIVLPTAVHEWWVEVHCYGGDILVSEKCSFKLSTGEGQGVVCVPPTCEDGLQNGQETGIDCGGSDCTSCPTCEDGIQNGAETDVDCGGPECMECPVCKAPEGLYADGFETFTDRPGGLQFGKVRMHWEKVPLAIAYKHIFVLNGFSTQTITTTQDTFVEKTLWPDLTYRWWVEAICANNEVYPSASCTFTIETATSDCPATNAISALPGFTPSLPAGIKAWPNPASETLHISLHYPDQQDLELRIRDIRGVTVARMFLNNGTQVLRQEVGHLPSGVYLISVSNGQFVEQLKVVIR